MPSTRRVDVLLFAGLRQRAGADQVSVELPPGATVAQLRVALQTAYPQLGSLTHCRVAVNHAFAADEESIETDVELAVIPPVSGGHDGPAPAVGSHTALSHAPLQLEALVSQVSHAGAGGISTFTGQVRRQSRGKTVTHLEYEAYAPMALAVMDKIAREIEARIPDSCVRIHHRLGRLEVGDIAVVIAASAPHRAEAFDACRAAIEELKRDVPIWKKEFDVDGGAWIGQGP